MTVYTGRGDEGETDLGNAERVSKTSPRIEAYGTVDEANALVGRVRPTGHEDVDRQLEQIQNCLHVVQAEFANPDTGEDDPQIGPGDIDQLEAWMDEADDELRSPPSSSPAAATPARDCTRPARSPVAPSAARSRSRRPTASRSTPRRSAT
mgnify:CR=1 FL=1